jgi:hypothetical protein
LQLHLLLQGGVGFTTLSKECGYSKKPGSTARLVIVLLAGNEVAEPSKTFLADDINA